MEYVSSTESGLRFFVIKSGLSSGVVDFLCAHQSSTSFYLFHPKTQSFNVFRIESRLVTELSSRFFFFATVNMSSTLHNDMQKELALSQNLSILSSMI